MTDSYVASARFRPEPISETDISALKQFVRWCIQESAFNGCDLDGGEVQEKALELGLLVEEPFDAEKHDPQGVRVEYWVDAGEPWFTFAPMLSHSHRRPASSGRNLADANSNHSGETP